MATINAPSVLDQPPTPSDGGPAIHFGKFTFAANPIADKVRRSLGFEPALIGR